MARIINAPDCCDQTRLHAASLWFAYTEPPNDQQPVAVLFDPLEPNVNARYEWAHIHLGVRGFFIINRNVWLVPDFQTAVLLALRFE